LHVLRHRSVSRADRGGDDGLMQLQQVGRPLRPALRFFPAAADLDGLISRCIDVVVSAGLLLLLSPLLLLTVLLIRLDSAGPVLFAQERVGRHGERFRMWKFRTMHESSDQSVHQELARAWFRGDQAAHGYRDGADSRVTRVGRLLRSADVDELPQLLNVLQGQMSLVGPRPAIVYELQYYEPGYYERLRVKPGITGPWQVSGRDRRTAAEMIAMDLDYVVNRSAWNDLKILARTIPVVLADMAAVLR